MDRDDQEMVNFYERVVKKAAEYKMTVDFHGAYKPTGLRRTYPNLLTREGVMGLEYSKWSDRITPEHDVTLPFTRMLAGPMDYTPGGFRNTARVQFKPVFVEPMTRKSNTAVSSEAARMSLSERAFRPRKRRPRNSSSRPSGYSR